MQEKRSTSHEEIRAKVESLTSSPVAFEALWDGDSGGWFVCFSAVTSDGHSHHLGVISDGGDIRLFNGQAPPWPEALVAQQLGSELAAQTGAQFYFPSPHYPEDDCPTWNDRDKGVPCRRCGIPLLQRPDLPWVGICYHCHLKEEREQREAQWTPEQRQGPRCHICGHPATGELNGAPACAECFDKYEVYRCEKCGGVTMLHKLIGHTSLCSRCELQNAIDLLTEPQRNTIRAAMAKGYLEGIESAIEVMGCSLYDAQDVVQVLGKPDATEERV